MSSAEEYVADVIDKACQGWGCDETLLVELFCTKTNAEMRAGKDAWEGRTDRSLIDYLSKELSSGHPTLLSLLLKLLKGDRDESDATDEARAAEQATALHDECSKVDGWFSSDFKVGVLINSIGGNNNAQNALLADVYERTYNVSLGKDLHKKVDDKLHLALTSLLLPAADFVASRLERAMKGWSNDNATLITLLGGLDGLKMHATLEAYER
eukprot:1584795-Prymnesium_polylepis.1